MAPHAGPFRLLSVGRAVEKKGYGDLMEALARLPAELDWHFTHIGGGALKDRLKADAERLALTGRIDWLGAQPQPVVLEHYRKADAFVLASRIADDGDRDGLPNVLMEAQSQMLACISTRVSAVPELIEDGVTGLLVEPGDVGALADAIARLARDPRRRQALAEAGAKRVHSRFGHAAWLDRLARRFGIERPARDSMDASCASLSMHR
jgi:glycosyltransferase involved in cell wall biosynthesis